MPVDSWPSTVRRWLRRIELTFSILLLAALAVIAVSISAVLDEIALWIGFLLPGLLGLAALVGAGLDAHGLIRNRESSRIRGSSRWIVIGGLAVAGAIGLLAVVTLFVVVQTILVVTVVDTGGGVMFGPILFMFSGSILAVAVLLRSAGETVLVARGLLDPPNTRP